MSLHRFKLINLIYQTGCILRPAAGFVRRLEKLSRLIGLTTSFTSYSDCYSAGKARMSLTMIIGQPCPEFGIAVAKYRVYVVCVVPVSDGRILTRQ